MHTTLLPMSPFEVAVGWVGGRDPVVPLPKGRGRAPRPREVLEEELRSFLATPPCVIGFSGGRDSSALLAVAVHVARRDGLPDPVPVTKRYPGLASADEDDWQELVVRHLDLDDWHRIDIAPGQMDVVGPLAAPGLRRHGVCWPVTMYGSLPIFAHARGGSYLSGEGGDEVFGPQRTAPVARVRARLSRPTAMAGPALRSLSPKALRRPLVRSSVRRHVERYRWLRPDVREQLAERLADEQLAAPLRWNRSMWALQGDRSPKVGFHNLRALAASAGVCRFGWPLRSEAFLAAFARAGGAVGFASRRLAMRWLFGDLLPPAVLERQTKAEFTGAFFSEHSRAFIKGWDGTGVDPAFVDAEQLHAEWQWEQPHAGSIPLVQVAWLASHREQTSGARDNASPRDAC